MLELNRILVFFVILSSLLNLYYSIRYRSKGKMSSWIYIMFSIITITGFSLLFFPRIAGFIGMAMWIPFVLLPGFGVKYLQRLIFKGDFSRSYKLSKFLGWIHPMDKWKEQPELIKIFHLIKEGKIEETESILEKYNNPQREKDRIACSYFLAATGQFNEFLNWVKENFEEEGLSKYPELILRYLLALGETGQLKKMVETFDKLKKTLQAPTYKTHLMVARLYLFAFSGRTDLVEKILAGPLFSYPKDQKKFWLATSDLTVGQKEKSLPEFEFLLNSTSYSIRLYSQNRINSGLYNSAGLLSEDHNRIIQREEKEIEQEKRFGSPLSFTKHKKKAYATYSLMAVIIFFFVLELIYGGSWNPITLFRLGAMIKTPDYHIEWWRLVTSLFLHGGPIHLILNLLSLFIIGPHVEKNLGRFRFLCVYLLSGIGSMFLTTILSNRPFLVLIGASGCIMGLLGAMSLLLFLGYKKEKSRLALSSYKMVIFIFTIQFIIDIITPQISMTAHLTGFFLGIMVTYLIIRKKAQPTET